MGCYSGNNILTGSFYRIFNFPVLNAKLQLSSGKVNTVFFYWFGLLFGGFFKVLKKKKEIQDGHRLEITCIKLFPCHKQLML